MQETVETAVREAKLAQILPRTESEKLIQRAEDAEAAMTEEYHVLRQVYDKNPTMAALARGVNSIRELRKALDA